MPLPAWRRWGLRLAGIRLTQVESSAGGPVLKQNTTPTHREASNNQDKAMLAQPILSTQQLDTAAEKICRVYLWRRRSVLKLRVA